MRPSTKRTPISLRVEQEILAWFRNAAPKGYQALMHQVLAEHVNRQKLNQARVTGRAQEIFKQYHAQCFWHYDPKLTINRDNLHIVIDGLRKHGGRAGYQLAEDLICR